MLEKGGPAAAQQFGAQNVAGGAMEAVLTMQRQASNESLNAQRRDTTKEETAEALLEKLQKNSNDLGIGQGLENCS